MSCKLGLSGVLGFVSTERGGVELTCVVVVVMFVHCISAFFVRLQYTNSLK